MLARSSKLIAIEVDPVLVHYLKQKVQTSIEAGKLEILESDVLRVDLATLTQGSSEFVIAGNLPYYITSPILDKIFASNSNWKSATFLVQAEVAERITAQPGSRDFGYLSVLCQVYADCELLFGVPRDAFRPPPKVENAVVRLTRRDAGITDLPGFLKFAQACFRQKRKTLRNNVGPVYGLDRIDKLPEAKMRAEQLSVVELVALFEKVTRSA